MRRNEDDGDGKFCVQVSLTIERILRVIWGSGYNSGPSIKKVCLLMVFKNSKYLTGF